MKSVSNMQGAPAGGSDLILFIGVDSNSSDAKGMHTLRTSPHRGTEPCGAHGPGQLLATTRLWCGGTDVDEPDKSVTSLTVESPCCASQAEQEPVFNRLIQKFVSASLQSDFIYA